MTLLIIIYLKVDIYLIMRCEIFERTLINFAYLVVLEAWEAMENLIQ